MLAPEEERYIWEDLLHSISNLLGDVDSGRSQVRERWDDPTPAFDRLEHLLSDAYEHIEDRLQELDPMRREQAAREQAQRQARKAVAHGVNFQAFRGLPYDETDAALMYIEEHGLVSMNYEATRKALQEYRASRRTLPKAVSE